jgi:hypothetical protein|tara:strand:- start:101 stop:343 length:243 start_codon:yes stop_codon:yes gene_type:complete
MIGGGMKVKKILDNPNPTEVIGLTAVLLGLFLLRAYVVQISYNIIWPKLVTNSGSDDSEFRPINYYEALMMVILFSFLLK